jgi:hypothetical protein
MIIRNLETVLAKGRELQARRKAITALFPYAIWRWKNGQREMLDVFFRIVGAAEEHMLRQPSTGTAPERQGYMWHRAEPFFTDQNVVRSIRELQDVNILKSYLNLLWSERWPLRHDGFSEMHASMCEDFAGIGMSYHRVDLIRMLDHFIGQLEHEQAPLESAMEGQYLSLREALLAAEKGASDILTGTRFGTIAPFWCAYSGDTHRIPFGVCLCAPADVFVVLFFVSSAVVWHFTSHPSRAHDSDLDTLFCGSPVRVGLGL